jgi:hypothetical protein
LCGGVHAAGAHRGDGGDAKAEDAKQQRLHFARLEDAAAADGLRDGTDADASKRDRGETACPNDVIHGDMAIKDHEALQEVAVGSINDHQVEGDARLEDADDEGADAEKLRERADGIPHVQNDGEHHIEGTYEEEDDDESLALHKTRRSGGASGPGAA